MIKTTVGIELDYSTLENILQERLNTNAGVVSPLSVRCFERDNSLVIIIEHAEDVISHPRRIFRLIRNIIQEKKIVGEVMMYLVVHGKTKPEYFNQITLYSDTDKDKNVQKQENDSPESENGKNAPNQFIVQKQKAQSSLLLIILASILGLAGISTLIYGLSRPCVVGSCTLLTETTELADKSLLLISENKEYVSLIDIKKQLNQSIEQLNTIPVWSKYYNQAEDLINNYQIKINHIDKAIQAINLGTQAESITENSSLSTKESQEVVNLLENSIRLLQEIPEDNNDSYFSNKQQQYQEKLASVNTKINLEREATKYLLTAQDAAQLAQSRQTLAKDLANLKLVEATWKTAIERLEKVSIETSAYNQKKQLLNIYIPKYSESQQKTREEEAAINWYNQARKQVKLAQDYKAQNQWSLAVSALKNSIESLGKISIKSFQYQEAVKLLNSSKQELVEAQAKLQTVLKIEQVKNDLQNTCIDSPKICIYSVNTNLIRVFLTNSYIEIIQQTSDPNLVNNPLNNTQMINHISQVENNLKYISSKYGIPLEVYHPEGNLMMKYQP